jgi:hypothetical protein
MSSYVLILRGRQYSALLNNAAPGTAAHAALLEATAPTATRHRAVLCEKKAAEELICLAEQFCPDTIEEIARQIHGHLSVPDKPDVWRLTR